MKKYDENREFRNSLKNELFPNLMAAFKSRNFKKMGALLGDFTVITHPDGKRTLGSDNISDFFKHEMETKDKIEFDLISSYAREVSEPGKKDDDIWHVGHAIIEFTGSRGSMTLSFRHPLSCVWDP